MRASVELSIHKPPVPDHSTAHHRTRSGPAWREAPGISDRQCARLGIEIVRLETELLLEANDLPRSLSATDRLSVVACDHHSWTLVTNDRALRNVCKDRGIRLRWGLGLMVDLVHAGVLGEARALKIALAIQRRNPTHITAGLIDRFRARLKER